MLRRMYSEPVTTATAKSLQSCLTMCDPIDGSPPGSAVPGILQARTLEWIAISFYSPRWGVFTAMSHLWPGVCWGGDAEVNHLLEALMSGFPVAPW